MRPNIPHFEAYPPHLQEMFSVRISQIITEAFVYTADSDYVTARFMALSGMKREFFWPALHALEKYMKAILLFDGQSVKEDGHKIVNLARRVFERHSNLKSLKLVPAARHRDLVTEGLWGPVDAMGFLEAITKFGEPSNRYDYFGAHYEASQLLKLDQFVHALRRLCLDDEPLRGTGKHEKYDYFAFQENIPFAPPSYEQGSPYGKLSFGMSVPAIEIALKGVFGHPEVFETWLLGHIRIKQSEIDAIKAL